MNSTAFVGALVRFVLLLMVQVFVFNQVSWGWGGREYLFVFVYPLFVALLPFRAARPLVILLGFTMGLTVDFFSESLGLHAGALTFTAYSRPAILRVGRPRDGYNIKASPSIADMGGVWMSRYLFLSLTVHALAYFVLQAFSLVFVGEILLKVLFSTIASFIVAGILVLIFNPKS